MNFIWQQFISVFMCMALPLGTTACRAQNEKPVVNDVGSTAEATSPSQGDKADVVDPVAEPEQVDDSLQLLYSDMARSEHLAGAVAYLGHREQGDSTPVADWLRENCPEMTEFMPFLLSIPAERILGAGYGNLYCIVPRNENTTLTVSHVTWVKKQLDVTPAMNEIYRKKSAQPVLVFVNPVQDAAPDVHITLERDNGLAWGWFPMLEEDGSLNIPVAQDVFPVLLDFGMGGSAAGPYEWWTTPTDEQLGDTSWLCGEWLLQLHWGDGEPEYAGEAEIYYQPGPGQAYELFYFGNWRMEGDYLWLDLFDGACYCVEGLFPVLIDSYGENLQIQQEEGMSEGYLPFFDEGVNYADLIRVYG